MPGKSAASRSTSDCGENFEKEAKAMSHRISAQTAKAMLQQPISRENDVEGLPEAFTLAKNDSGGVPEEFLTCSSPVCDVRFEQTGIVRMEPRKYCCDRCRLDAWHLREVAKLLEGFTDDEALRILKFLS
jgi:hypothetical protein